MQDSYQLDAVADALGRRAADAFRGAHHRERDRSTARYHDQAAGSSTGSCAPSGASSISRRRSRRSRAVTRVRSERVLSASCRCTASATRSTRSASPFRCSGWTIDLDHFRTESQNFFDHNPIGNSDVFLPITITGALIRRQRAHGALTAVLELRGQVYVTYSNQTADGTGTITGGLTNFSPLRAAITLSITTSATRSTSAFDAELPWQAYASMNLYFGSGFSNGDAPPSHLPSHGTSMSAWARRSASALRLP